MTKPSTRVEIPRQLARQAAAVLEWWADDQGDDPEVIAHVKAGRAIASKLRRLLAERRHASRNR